MSQLILSLLTFAIIATASPGGATTLATASGAQFGFTRSLPLIAGIALGLASLVGLVGGVLGAVIVSWPQFQLVLRVVGSCYLLWLAWTISRLGAPNAPNRVHATPKRFITGVLLLWLNPKAWTMGVTVATVYTELSDNPVRLAVIVGLVFGLAALVSLTLWCMGGLWLSTLLKTEQHWRAVNVVLALLLAASVLPMWW